LKVPLGALTAFTGVLIIQSGLIAGICPTGVKRPGSRLAVVFGYSQQLLTSLVDNRAKSVVNSTSGERNDTASN
jgi:hypothetical protein